MLDLRLLIISLLFLPIILSPRLCASYFFPPTVTSTMVMVSLPKMSTTITASLRRPLGRHVLLVFVFIFNRSCFPTSNGWFSSQLHPRQFKRPSRLNDGRRQSEHF